MREAGIPWQNRGRLPFSPDGSKGRTDNAKKYIPDKTHSACGGFEYQDCKPFGESSFVCSGKKGLLWVDGVVDIIRFERYRSEEPTPYEVCQRTRTPRINHDGRTLSSFVPGRPLSHNAMDYEILPAENGGKGTYRFYFVPHDHPDTKLLINDLAP